MLGGLAGFSDEAKIAFFDLIALIPRVAAGITASAGFEVSDKEANSLRLCITEMWGPDGIAELQKMLVGMGTEVLTARDAKGITETAITNTVDGSLGMRLTLSDGSFIDTFSEEAQKRARSIMDSAAPVSVVTETKNKE